MDKVFALAAVASSSGLSEVLQKCEKYIASVATTAEIGDYVHILFPDSLPRIMALIFEAQYPCSSCYHRTKDLDLKAIMLLRVALKP